MTECPLVRPLQQHDIEFPRYLRRAGVKTYSLRRANLHVHHVWPGQRVTNDSSVVTINAFVHDYLHDMGGPPLRVAGIWARRQSPGFRWDKLDAAAGLSVRGWLALDKCHDLPRPYCWWREELINEA